MATYTTQGDTGTTTLLSGETVDKDDLRISTIGTLDELNSSIGLARIKAKLENVSKALEYVQIAINQITTFISEEGKGETTLPHVSNLEEVIDEVEKILPPLKGEILPGGHEGAAHLIHARAICRRSERLITALNRKFDLPNELQAFINRASDFLLIMARYVNQYYMVEEKSFSHTTTTEAEETTEVVNEKQITVEEAVDLATESSTEEAVDLATENTTEEITEETAKAVAT